MAQYTQYVNISSGNGLSPNKWQAITWTNADMLSTGLMNNLQWNLKSKYKHTRKMYLKIYAKWDRFVQASVCKQLQVITVDASALVVVFKVLNVFSENIMTFLSWPFHFNEDTFTYWYIRVESVQNHLWNALWNTWCLIQWPQWVISFRANYSTQLTCIPFAVTNKALPVKGLAKDPINKLIFLQF